MFDDFLQQLLSGSFSVAAFLHRAGAAMLENTGSHGRDVERRVPEMGVPIVLNMPLHTNQPTIKASCRSKSVMTSTTIQFIKGNCQHHMFTRPSTAQNVALIVLQNRCCNRLHQLLSLSELPWKTNCKPLQSCSVWNIRIRCQRVQRFTSAKPEWWTNLSHINC